MNKSLAQFALTALIALSALSSNSVFAWDNTSPGPLQKSESRSAVDEVTVETVSSTEYQAIYRTTDTKNKVVCYATFIAGSYSGAGTAINCVKVDPPQPLPQPTP
jgi:hypothetical protein